MTKIATLFILAISFVLTANTVNAQTTPATPLSITTSSIPYTMEANRRVGFPVTATGGTEPYEWSCKDVHCWAGRHVEDGPLHVFVEWDESVSGQQKIVLVVTDKNNEKAEKEFVTSVTPFVPNLVDLWKQQRMIFTSANSANADAGYAKRAVSSALPKIHASIKRFEATQARMLKRERYMVYAIFGLFAMNFIFLIVIFFLVKNQVGFRIWRFGR
jgi:hypothetical protein